MTILSQNIGTFQTEVNSKFEDVTKEVKSVKRKLEEESEINNKRERRNKEEFTKVDRNFAILEKEILELKQNTMTEDRREIQSLWEELDSTCERYNRNIGLQPICARTMGELREYLHTISARVTPDNLIAWGVRNYLLNEMVLVASKVEELESAIVSIIHDGN